MFSPKALVMIVVIATVSNGTMARAALINVNFEAFTPGGTDGNPPGTFIFETEAALSGPAGGLNTQWNQFAASDSSGVMVDATGAPTTVTFTTNFTESRRGSNANVLPIYNSSLTDFGKGAARNLTINGLEAGREYNIWLVAYRDQTTAPERLSGTWSTANPTTSANSQLLDSTLIQSDLAFQQGVTFVLFQNVLATGAGTIVFNGQATITDLPIDGNDFRLGLSGFQILAVPEPASVAIWSLLGLGLVGAGVYRARRTLNLDRHDSVSQ